MRPFTGRNPYAMPIDGWTGPRTFIDYNIRQEVNGDITVLGEDNTPSELLVKKLFEPGDVFVVSADGTLSKMDNLSKFLIQGKWDGCSTTN